MIERGRLAVTYLRPLDLSVDEMLAEIQSAVERLGATRVVIDSLSGFEVALAPTYRMDFRESLYRLVGALTATGVTVLMTAEVIDAYPGAAVYARARLVHHRRHLRAAIRRDRRPAARRCSSVVKMRGSDHATDFRLYRLTAEGAVMGNRSTDYHGITTGVPELAEPIIAVAADD